MWSQIIDICLQSLNKLFHLLDAKILFPLCSFKNHKFLKKQIIQKLGHGFVEDIPLNNIYQIQVLRGTHKGANFHLSS